MHWQNTQVTMGSSDQQTSSTLASQSPGDTGLHWSLLCQRSSKNLQHDHLPAVITMLSSKLKEPEEFPEVTGSRERTCNCKLKRRCAGTPPPFKSQRRRQVPETQYRGTGGRVWKDPEDCSMGSWALCLRHCRAQTPSSHPSNYAACF